MKNTLHSLVIIRAIFVVICADVTIKPSCRDHVTRQRGHVTRFVDVCRCILQTMYPRAYLAAGAMSSPR